MVTVRNKLYSSKHFILKSYSFSVLCIFTFTCNNFGNKDENKQKKEKRLFASLAILLSIPPPRCSKLNAIDIGLASNESDSPCIDRKIESGAIYNADTKQVISGSTITSHPRLECKCPLVNNPGPGTDLYPVENYKNPNKTPALRWFTSDIEPVPSGYKLKQIFSHQIIFSQDSSLKTTYSVDSFSSYSSNENLYCVYRCVSVCTPPIEDESSILCLTSYGYQKLLVR